MANKNKNEALVKALLNLTAPKIDNSKMANQLKGFPQGMGSKQGVYKLPADYNVKNEIKDAALLANSFAPVTGDIQSGVMAAQDLAKGNYGSAALNGLGLLPFVPSMAGMIASKGDKVADAIRPLTEFEQKQLTAQKNAVEMLGLPPNNTAMDRAMAMGHDTPAYTGVNTTGEINEMLPKSWFSEQPKYASDYSDVIPKSGVSQEPRVYPVMLKTGKVKSKQYVGLYDDMESALSKKNIDTFKVENVGGGSNNFYVIKNPNQVRSIHAAFDPARANEADLLGSITPEMAGLLAVGSGAGVGYAYNKKEKKKTK